jgi:hypothetical protein
VTVEKAFLQTERGDRIPCLFNPSELELSARTEWRGRLVPGRNAPELEFGGGRSGSLRLALTFDTSSDGSAVTKHTSKLLELMQVDTRLPSHDAARNTGRPGWVKFHWGDLHSFTAVIEQLDLTFTFFSSGGVPLRARAALVLRQFKEDGRWGPQNPTSGTPMPHRTHQVRRGETLDRIAAAHYGDARRWRLIAQANGITNPMDVQPGTVLALPDPQEASDAR